MEERLEILSRRRFEAAPDIGEARGFETIIAVETPQTRHEPCIADALAQHVPYHRALAIADSLGRCIVAGAEFTQWKIILRGHVVRHALQDIATVGTALAPLFLHQVIGQVGGEAFAPIPAANVDEDPVAPPIVQEFVGIRRGQNEWETDDLLTQQGEARHAVACFPKIFHQCELTVRIRTQQRVVHLQILRGRVQIAGGERLIRGPQERISFDRPGGSFELGKYRRDQVHLLRRCIDTPGLMYPAAADGLRCGRVTHALADRLPSGREVGLQTVGDQRFRNLHHPMAGPGKIHAARLDQSRRLTETTAGLRCGCGDRIVDDPLVMELEV